jgi:hypothetical protein
VGVRVRAGLHRAAGQHRAGEGRRPGEEGGPDRWGPAVGGRRRRANTLSGRRDSGPGPNSGLGQNRPPGLLFFFLFLFLFLFYFLI